MRQIWNHYETKMRSQCCLLSFKKKDTFETQNIPLGVAASVLEPDKLRLHLWKAPGVCYFVRTTSSIVSRHIVTSVANVACLTKGRSCNGHCNCFLIAVSMLLRSIETVLRVLVKGVDFISTLVGTQYDPPIASIYSFVCLFLLFTFEKCLQCDQISIPNFFGLL